MTGMSEFDSRFEYVEHAKEEKRQRHRAACKAKRERKKKEQEKKTSDDTAGSASAKSHAKKPGKRRPARRVHPKLKSLYHSISWRALVDPVEQEGLDVLCDFLVRACRIGKGEQAIANQLFERYLERCEVFGVSPLGRALVSNSLKDLGAVEQKGKARIEQWKGVTVDVQALPHLPLEDTSIDAGREAKQQMLKFIGLQVRSPGWGVESLAKAYACYRAWCRRMDLHPLSHKQLAQELDRDPRAMPEGGRGKNRSWSGIRGLSGRRGRPDAAASMFLPLAIRV